MLRNDENVNKQMEKWGSQILDLLESQFFKECELILYGFSDKSSTILDYRNNRACKMPFIPEQTPDIVRGKAKDGDSFNEVRSLSSDCVVKTSIIFLHDSSGDLFGAICLNQDVTELIRFNNLLGTFSCAESISCKAKADGETLDVSSLLDRLIQEAKSHVGKDLSNLNKDERFSFLEYLDRHGAFQISKSSVIISDLLEISKFTLYNDLDKIRSLRANASGPSGTGKGV